MVNFNSLTPAYSFESLEFGTDSDKMLVRLSARTNGVWAWVLSLFKIRSGMTFEVYRDRVVLNQGWRHVIPVRHVSNLGSGYQSSWLFWLLMWFAALVSAFCLFKGVFGAFVVWGVFAALFGYLYVRSRRFVVDVKGTSGHSAYFGIKRSYVGGVALPDDDLYRMVDVIQGLIVRDESAAKLNTFYDAQLVGHEDMSGQIEMARGKNGSVR